MTDRRGLFLWIAAALAANALLLSVLFWKHEKQEYARSRWGIFLAGDQEIGLQIFQEKGCAQCHSVQGVGEQHAPDLPLDPAPDLSPDRPRNLPLNRESRVNLNQVVVSMWNHAPRMWERMRTDRVAYPTVSQEEMAHLFAYLFTVTYNEAGDAERGKKLFEEKGCLNCHAVHGHSGDIGRGGDTGHSGGIGPDIATLGHLISPIAWAQAMWNHAPAMEIEMEAAGLPLPWPQFEGRDMNDLFAYLRQATLTPGGPLDLLPADPEEGRALFTEKLCIACHRVGEEGGRQGFPLGPRPEASPSLVQFSGWMWNHSPELWRQAGGNTISRPSFDGRQMADLVAFLYSIGYFESVGSAQTGARLFARRGCGRCHGFRAEGTERAAALRVRDDTPRFTSITLATALWRHGPRMVRRSQNLGIEWPALKEGDLPHLLAFLNRHRAD